MIPRQIRHAPVRSHPIHLPTPSISAVLRCLARQLPDEHVLDVARKLHVLVHVAQGARAVPERLWLVWPAASLCLAGAGDVVEWSQRKIKGWAYEGPLCVVLAGDLDIFDVVGVGGSVDLAFETLEGFDAHDRGYGGIGRL